MNPHIAAYLGIDPFFADLIVFLICAAIVWWGAFSGWDKRGAQ